MTRIGALLCKLNFHAFREVDEFGRGYCERCGARQPKRVGPIRESDRVMTRTKTRPGKVLPTSKQKRFVQAATAEGEKR